MIKALPVTEFKPFAHQLQCGIPIPHDLMAGWPIIVSIKKQKTKNATHQTPSGHGIQLDSRAMDVIEQVAIEPSL